MSSKTIKKFILILVMIILSGPVFGQEKELHIEKIINFFAFGTGSTTGTYFPLGNAFAHVWTQKSKSINVMTYSSNGSYENIELLRNHEVNLAIAQSDIVSAALNGKGKFLGRPFKDLKVLMALYPEVIQIVVPENSDIKTLSDLKNHRINVGAINSGNALTAVEFLSELNIKENEYTKINMSYDEAIQAMEKNECDATIIIAGIPTKVILELKKRIAVRIIDIPLQTVAEAIQKLPYLSAFTIADDIYGDSKQTSTLAVMALLVSNSDLKDDLAYDLLKMLFDNLDYLKIIHERARDLSIKNALRGIKKEYLHPGAEKYLEEAKQMQKKN